MTQVAGPPRSAVRRLVADTTRPLRYGGRRLAESAVRAMARHQAGRRLLENWYRALSPMQKQRVHAQFSHIFDGRVESPQSGDWSVTLAGKTIRIPIRTQSASFDWKVALSVLGHDAAVKATYEAFLVSSHRPDLFIDIGANIGTHVVCFAVHDVPMLAFEPNPESRAYLQDLCASNGRTVRVEPVALGDHHATVTLSYPDGETWFGSTDPRVVDSLHARGRLHHVEVPLRCLDDYVDRIPDGRILMKIDTEGHEIAVLRGAMRVLRERRPIVILEAWMDASRKDLHAFLLEVDYVIAALPWDGGRARVLDDAAFAMKAVENFVAIPAEQLRAA